MIDSNISIKIQLIISAADVGRGVTFLQSRGQILWVQRILCGNFLNGPFPASFLSCQLSTVNSEHMLNRIFCQ